MLQPKMKSENTYNKYWKFLGSKGEHMDQLRSKFIFQFSIVWKVIQCKAQNK